jgi:hypothetical protein
MGPPQLSEDFGLEVSPCLLLHDREIRDTGASYHGPLAKMSLAEVCGEANMLYFLKGCFEARRRPDRGSEAHEPEAHLRKAIKRKRFLRWVSTCRSRGGLFVLQFGACHPGLDPGSRVDQKRAGSRIDLLVFRDDK